MTQILHVRKIILEVSRTLTWPYHCFVQECQKLVWNQDRYWVSTSICKVYISFWIINAIDLYNPFWVNSIIQNLVLELDKYYTRESAQVVTNLQQTCIAVLLQQLVNRMCSHCLFPACWHVVNGLLTTCYTVVELKRLVTSCSNNWLLSCNSSICQQVVSDNLVATR
jgi:hypothetical protein